MTRRVKIALICASIVLFIIIAASLILFFLVLDRDADLPQGIEYSIRQNQKSGREDYLVEKTIDSGIERPKVVVTNGRVELT